MDVKRILESIEQCTFKCDKCEFSETECHVDYDRVHVVLAIRDHVRSEVVAQAREWASKTSVEDMTTECCGRLLAMLDELSKEGMDNARRTVKGACYD